MGEDWSHEEVEAAVADYLVMLDKELRHEPYNKAEHNRNLQQLLVNRTRGSIERKHMNTSAVLIELGYPYIEGYKPLGNYQEMLGQVVEERLSGARNLQQAVESTVEARVETPPNVSDILSIWVPPPTRESDRERLYEKPPSKKSTTPRNYLEIEARNQSLGRAGEQMVIKYEQSRLSRAGKENLANRIEHVPSTKGDALGFDILSFETDGRERLIEVKTTRFGQWTPFFASKNEVDVSSSRERDYQLYRLFNFARYPKLFILPGSLSETCILDPVQFSARPR
jgi:hypothetical protein